MKAHLPPGPPRGIGRRLDIPRLPLQFHERLATRDADIGAQIVVHADQLSPAARGLGGGADEGGEPAQPAARHPLLRYLRKDSSVIYVFHRNE